MANRQRYLIDTPVRTTVSEAAGHLQHVSINLDQITSVADDWADDEFELPDWRIPVFINEYDKGTTVNDVIDFLFIGNSINFAFRDFNTGEKFKTVYNGVEWGGAMGMWACLKRAFENGVPILSGEYLSSLSLQETRSLFAAKKDPKIPMLKERYDIVTSIGDTLVTEYDGRFHRFVDDCEPKLFADGEGIVDRLVSEFPSFDDTHEFELPDRDISLHFYKRAQLAPAMTYGRFQSQKSFSVQDPEAFTVFADYNLPNILRHLGILDYDDTLTSLIDEGQLLEAGCREEIELRCATIYASDLLLEGLNDRRQSAIYGPHLDYKLFSERTGADTPVHQTKTIHY